MKKNDFDKAIECYEKAIELGSNDAYTNIGVAYSQKGDCDKAIEYYKKAEELATEEINGSGDCSGHRLSKPHGTRK